MKTMKNFSIAIAWEDITQEASGFKSQLVKLYISSLPGLEQLDFTGTAQGLTRTVSVSCFFHGDKN